MTQPVERANGSHTMRRRAARTSPPQVPTLNVRPAQRRGSSKPGTAAGGVPTCTTVATSPRSSEELPPHPTVAETTPPAARPRTCRRENRVGRTGLSGRSASESEPDSGVPKGRWCNRITLAPLSPANLGNRYPQPPPDETNFSSLPAYPIAHQPVNVTPNCRSPARIDADVHSGTDARITSRRRRDSRVRHRDER